MNQACLALVLLLPGFQVKAQTDTPEQFLAMLPKPSAIRSYRPSAGGPDAFRTDLQEKLKRMDTTLKAMEQRLGGAAKESAQRTATAMGVPPEVASGKKRLTKEERQAMANQMLQAQLGPGAPTAQELKAMSPEERRAWAMNYGNKVAADARANPGKYQPPKNMPKAQDIQRLQTLEQEIQTLARKYQGRYQALQLEGAELSKPSGRDYSSSMTVSPEDRQRAAQMVAPKLGSLVEEQVADIKANLGKCKEADELLARQNGMEKSPAPGLHAMRIIRECLENISKALGSL